MTGRILIIEDDSALTEFIRLALETAGFVALEATSGEAGLELFERAAPDAVLLDMGLPGMSGLEVIHQLRRASGVPVLFMSVRDDEGTIVSALDAGADDYLLKPLRVSEMLARLRAALRRRPEPASGPLSCGDLRLDEDSRSVWVGPRKLPLTPNECGLLRVLLQNVGQVVSHRTLLVTVWGEEYADETKLLRVHVSNLRKKLETCPELEEFLRNIPGTGYVLGPPM